MTTRFLIPAVCLALTVPVVQGCGGGEEPASTEAPTEPGGDPSPSDGGTTSVTVEPEDDFNVFFDNPLQIASDQSELGGGGPPQVPSTAESPDMASTTEEPEEAAPAGGAVSWSELLPQEQLEAGMKNTRNELSRRLVNLGAYNGSYLEISKFASTLSLLAEIGRRHDEAPGWKEKAHLIRVLGAAMVEVTSSSTARGKKGYDAVNNSFLTVCEILDGNDPAAPPEADEEADITEAAEMAYLMQVVEAQLEWMQNNAGSEDAFKENAELAMREAALMAAIGEAFNSEGYGYGPASNDEEFEAFTYGFRDAAKGMFGAAKAGNFDDFDTARSAAAQKCVQCHSVYRNG